MNLRRISTRMLLIVPVCIASIGSVASAMGDVNKNGRVALPVIPMGQGDQCVKDVDFMRRNHMDLLQHQRDETMLKGVRSKQFSLKECINCHVVNGPDAMPVTASSAQHFCRSCHDYASVSIDCFQCHASRPDRDLTTGSHAEIRAGATEQ